MENFEVLANEFWTESGPDGAELRNLATKILSNIIEFPEQSKYRRINRIKVAPRVGKHLHFWPVLEAVGFLPPNGEGVMVLAEDDDATERVIFMLGILTEMAAAEKKSTGRDKESRLGGVALLEQKIQASKESTPKRAAKFKTTGGGGERRGSGKGESQLQGELKRLEQSSADTRKAAELEAARERQQFASLTKELEYLNSKLETGKEKENIIRRLSRVIDMTKIAKLPLPTVDCVDEVWRAHPSYRQRVIPLLISLLEAVVARPHDPKPRHLLKKTYFPRLAEVEGAIGLLQQMGFEPKETALVLPMSANLEPLSTTLTLFPALERSERTEREEKRKRKLERMTNSTNPTVGDKIAEVVEEVAERKDQLQQVERYLATNNKLGTAYRIEWTIKDWAGKDPELNKRYPCHPSITDRAMRKWTAYVIRIRDKMTTDRIQLFLECALPKSEPNALVFMWAKMLHSSSCAPILRVGEEESAYYEIRHYSATHKSWGWANFTTTEEMTTYGAYNPKEDHVRFQVDFCVRDCFENPPSSTSPTTTTTKSSLPK